METLKNKKDIYKALDIDVHIKDGGIVNIKSLANTATKVVKKNSSGAAGIPGFADLVTDPTDIAEYKALSDTALDVSNMITDESGYITIDTGDAGAVIKISNDAFEILYSHIPNTALYEPMALMSFSDNNIYGIDALLVKSVHNVGATK